MTKPITSASERHATLADAAPSGSSVPTPAPGPTCSVARNQLEVNERTFATAEHSLGEAALAGFARNLGPYQSVELGGKASGALELAAKGEAKLRIACRSDGQYEVEAFASFGAGVGVDKGKAFVGVAAGTKFVVATPEAAADLAQAIAALEVVGTAVAGANINLPFVLAVDAATGTSKDAMRRIAHYAPNLAALRCDLRGNLEVEFKRGPEAGRDGFGVDIKGSMVGAGELAVDLEKSRVTTSAVFENKGDATGTLDLSSGGDVMKQFGSRFGGKIEGKVVLRYEERRTLPAELKAKVASGELRGAALALAVGALPITRVVVAEVEAEAKGLIMGNASAKAKLTAEIPVVPGKVLESALKGDVEGLMQPLLDTKWTMKGEVGLGLEMKLAGGGFSVEGSAMHWTSKGAQVGTFRECAEKALKHFQESAELDASLAQQRALAGRPN